MWSLWFGDVNSRFSWFIISRFCANLTALYPCDAMNNNKMEIRSRLWWFWAFCGLLFWIMFHLKLLIPTVWPHYGCNPMPNILMFTRWLGFFVLLETCLKIWKKPNPIMARQEIDGFPEAEVILVHCGRAVIRRLSSCPVSLDDATQSYMELFHLFLPF